MDALAKCNEIQPVLERKWEIIWRHAFLCGAREIAKQRQYLWWEEMGDHDWGVARLHAGNNDVASPSDSLCVCCR